MHRRSFEVSAWLSLLFSRVKFFPTTPKQSLKQRALACRDWCQDASGSWCCISLSFPLLTERKMMTLASNRKPPNSHSKDAAKQSYREARQPKPGRPGVSSLSLPAKEFRPSELQHDFESKSFCLQEDVTRARLLKKTVLGLLRCIAPLS